MSPEIPRLFTWLEAVDPAPFFVLSLVPYLAFLYWAAKVRGFPRLALQGFRMTLVFVAVTIAAAIVAQVRYGKLLADVDGLHGGAEAFLTLSNLLVVLGFILWRPGEQVLRPGPQGPRPPEDGMPASES